MQQLATVLRQTKFNTWTALPDESQCPECGWFDTSHPDVKRLLLHVNPSGWLLSQASCRCVDAEAQRRRDEALRRQQANLPHPLAPRTLAGFTPRSGTGEALAAAVDFADGVGRRCLLIMGSTGSGKSHLLEGVGRRLLEKGRMVRYEVSSEFLERLRDCYRESSEQSVAEMCAWYAGRSVLLLDDLGLERTTDFAVERLTTLIDERLRMGWWLALATNLGPEELTARLGERLASRLYQGNPDLAEVRRVTLTAADYRRIT